MKKRILAIIILLFVTITYVYPICCINDYNSLEKVTYMPENKSATVKERKEVKEINYVYQCEADEIEMKIMNIVEVKRNEYIKKTEELQLIEDEEERFIAYKKIYDEYLEWADLPETIYDNYSEEEILLIQKVVETETFDCDFNSKVNIAFVVLNRVNSEEFGDTITEVVTAKNQFVYGRDNISDSTVLAVEYAFLNYDKTHEALYFHSGNKTNTFNKKQYKFTDQSGHHFY